MRSAHLSVVAACCAAWIAGVALSCQSTEPETGTLRVMVSLRPVAQIATDTDGVDLRLDQRPPVHLNAILDSLVTVIAIGPHTLSLADVEPNCSVVGGTTQVAMVFRDSTTLVLLGGTCQAP